MNNYFNEQSHIDVLWEMGYTGEGIRVGIVDTGIQVLSHPSICDNIIKGHNFSLDGSGRNNITSSSYHGLAVASLVTHVAPGVELVIAKVLDDEGCGNPMRTANGINYCINNNCDIINCSIAGPHEPILEEAVNRATNNDIMIVASSGNGGYGTINYPATYRNVISVGAIDKNYQIPYFSSDNPLVDLLAPGDNLTLPAKGYSVVDSGTSFSSPLVAGSLALLKEKFINDNNYFPTRNELYQELTKYYKKAINTTGGKYLDFREVNNSDIHR